MVKQRVVFHQGMFIDYKGNQRNYIMAAVSELMPESSSVIYLDENKPANLIMSNVVKKLSIGFAVCSPEDVWDEELGKTIALGKAIKRPARVMYVTDAGMINTRVVEALMEQEAVYFENNPGSVIKGYSDAEAKYNETV